MEIDQLKLFYGNEVMRDVVKAFLLEVLDVRALKKVYDGESTDSVKEARETIDEAFRKIADICQKKSKPKTENQAR